MSSGRKKLRALEAELLKLTTLRHPNLIHIYAVKLVFSGSRGKLVILSEEFPSYTLADALQDFGEMKEQKASVSFISLVTVMERTNGFLLEGISHTNPRRTQRGSRR